MADNSPNPFHDALHIKYLTSLGSKLDSATSYEGAVTEHLRMSGVYWNIAALSLLRGSEDVDASIGLTKQRDNDTRCAIIDWVFSCYDSKTGGFGGNSSGTKEAPNPHDAHLLYTLSALQILAMANCLDDERLNKEAVIKFVSGLQNKDGSFSGDKWGEIDTRFTYCAFSCLALLGRMPLPDCSTYDSTSGSDENEDIIDVNQAVRYIMSCHNSFDGGFGAVPGAESHAGQVFCCIGALSISHSLHLLNERNEDGVNFLSWWLAERQCDSGGLNGRPEKQADVCYSWWILSALSILGRVDWIDTSKLGRFILNCQDEDDGGIADRPNDMPDVYHTFFGLSGLSLIGHLGKIGNESERTYRQIDPVFALPSDVVLKVGLKAQVVKPTNGKLDSRLEMHSVL